MKDFNTLYDAGVISRFHTMRTNQIHTIAHHSWGVAMIVLKIWPDASAKLLKACMFHDLAEVVTGDVPAPTKWSYPRLGTALTEIERIFNTRHGLLAMDELNEMEKWVLRWADMMELVLFARSEQAMGNSFMDEVVARGLHHLSVIRAPTPLARDFLQEFTDE